MTGDGIYAFGGARKEVLNCRAERSSNRVRNRLWFYRARPVGSPAARRGFGSAELSTRPVPAAPVEAPIKLRREILMVSSYI
jgi:hypothetical protein